MEFAVIELDGPLVLFPAFEGFPLAVPLNLFADGGPRNRERDREDGKQKNNPQQNIAFLIMGFDGLLKMR